MVKEIRISGVNEEKLIKELSLYEDFKSGKQEDYSEIIPTREDVAVVYKQLLKEGYSLDKLVAMNLLGIGYAKTLISAEALCELKICSLFDVEGVRVIKVVNSGIKTDLQSAKILKQLRGDEYGA